MTEQEWYTLLNKKQLSNRKLRLFSVSCCYDIWDFLTDQRSKDVIIAAEQFADGLITKQELETARDLAWNAYSAVAGRAASVAGWAAANAAAANAAGWATAWNAYSAVAAASVKVREQKEKLYCQFLNDIVGNKQTIIDPRWLTSTVIDLSQTIYEEKVFERMPILSDALMDAGCDDNDILSHCREGIHVRGCWLLDLILEKS